jgi:hypothetical protein
MLCLNQCPKQAAHVTISLISIHLVSIGPIQLTQRFIALYMDGKGILLRLFAALSPRVAAGPTMLLSVLVAVKREPSHSCYFAWGGVNPPIDKIKVVPGFMNHELHFRQLWLALWGKSKKASLRQSSPCVRASV